jgi:hypothetical protein
VSRVPAPRGADQVRDAHSRIVLASARTYDEAVEAAHGQAWAIAQDIEGRLGAQGEGHAGGIEVRIEVIDGASGERLAAYAAWTGPVKAANLRRA